MPARTWLLSSAAGIAAVHGFGSLEARAPEDRALAASFAVHTPFVQPARKNKKDKEHRATDVRYLRRSGKLEVLEAPRVANGSVAARELIETYLSRDVPVVLTGAISPESVALLKRLAPIMVSSFKSWADEPAASANARARIAAHVREQWPLQEDGLHWHMQSSPGRLWGCRNDRLQCRLAAWTTQSSLGNELRDWSLAGPELPPSSGSFAHVDSHCAPAWALGVNGVKGWTFLKREPGDPTAFGDAYRESRTAYYVALQPGELMLIHTGWVSHATESNTTAGGADPAFSLHGNLYWQLDQLVPDLFGPAAMRRRCGEGSCRLSAHTAAYCGADILALNPGMVVAEAP